MSVEPLNREPLNRESAAAPLDSTIQRFNDSTMVIAHLSHVISQLTVLLELALLKGHAELATKQDLQRLEKLMAKTQAEIAQQLRDALAKLGKIESEQDKQAQLIKDLLEAAGNQPNATPELTEAADALTAELEVSDAKVDDAQTA
jgi:hypothetical protein